MLSMVVNAYAITKSGYKSAGEYGKLISYSSLYKSSNQKVASFSVETTAAAASKYIITYNIVYDNTGASITGNYTTVNSNMYTSRRSSESVDMLQWKNTQTGKRDGFLNTKISAFSTHEVRGVNAYADYLVNTL